MDRIIGIKEYLEEHMPEIEYGGIKKKYPVLQRIFGDKFTSWLLLVRPLTSLPALLAGILLTLATTSVTYPHIITGIYVGITLCLIQILGQITNQVMDVEIDKKAKPYRVLPRGLISKDEVIGIAWIISIFAIGRAFTIGLTFGILSLVMVFFAIFYSYPPFSPRKINPFLNIVWVSFARGFLPIIAVFSIYSSMLDGLKYAVFAFLWALSLQGTKDIPDMAADKSFGIKTIPNTYGVSGFVKYAAGISMIMYIYAYQFLPIMLALVPITILAFEGMEKQNKIFENTRAWLWYYFGLSTIYIIIFLNSILG